MPLADQLGELAVLRDEGKIRHIGISKVTAAQVEAAREITPIAAVQNKFNQLEGDRGVLDYCTEQGLAFVPYAPLGAGTLARGGGATGAITWLLSQSPAVLPIPGTTSIDHLHSNLAAVTRRSE
ncbi:aldo/keto reductase [Promicromonospora sp. NPDC057488]|uniref:aldo/keto reductase n=1 Tax=Promicromonospora sp. NPDC057488 TaxID=3346147 RepID=UPI0036728CCD